MQVAKQRRDSNSDEEEYREELRCELESQKNAWKQLSELEQQAEKKTLEVWIDGGNAMQSDIGSMGGLHFDE